MDLWTNVLDSISKKLSKPSFETWLAKTTAKIEDDVIIITAQNEFAVDWLEERYKVLIFETVREVAGQTYDIEFVSPNGISRDELPPSRKSSIDDYTELKSLVLKQSELLKAHEVKIEKMEKEILRLTQKQKSKRKKK